MRSVHVIINPGSGHPQPVLHTLNKVFREAKVNWEISLTKRAGDAERFAKIASTSGVDVVAAFGGDGTIMEAARGLMGSQTPLAILPGGTANLMSVELGIPKPLEKAAAIAADPKSIVRLVDVGQIGDTVFILRVGLGFSARKVRIADRQMKDKYGILAYSVGALKALKASDIAHYTMILDGQQLEFDGLACLVDNAGNMGVAGFSAGANIRVDDGLFDVIVVRDARIKSWVAVGTSMVGSTPDPAYIAHLQAREITIDAYPSQPVQVDGEMMGRTPVNIHVIPQAVRVLTAA